MKTYRRCLNVNHNFIKYIVCGKLPKSIKRLINLKTKRKHINCKINYFDPYDNFTILEPLIPQLSQSLVT